MDGMEVDTLVRQLATGFGVLQHEYRKLHGRHQALERKLAAAREQYNELAKLYGSERTSTPPLSLSSSPAHQKEDTFAIAEVSELLSRSNEPESKEAGEQVKAAAIAADSFRDGLPKSTDGVKIWSGPAADRQEGSSCMMPSISESPLEQDFTVEGKPSKLGCPFASMARKKLSSHAASVLSRYNQSNSIGAHGSVAASSTPLSTASRVNGRESLSRRQSRRASFVDPIKADICGLADDETPGEVIEKAPTAQPDGAEPGVCPIRFLDQHSPEEVATYFEKHKHELPRSHEVCVMRYQSNEDQIRELDAKYGNLVSMIQGLGQKHKGMLPEDPDDGADDTLSDAQVRKWASSVSAQAPEPNPEDEAEERQPHFERPLRDIRVGESPSRPWGIPVPAKYLEQASSETSSKPAQIGGPASPDEMPSAEADNKPQRPAGKCPFGHGGTTAAPPKPVIVEPDSAKRPETPPRPPTMEKQSEQQQEARPKTAPINFGQTKQNGSQMVFTGPVFIGYSPDDAAKMMSAFRTMNS